MTKFSEILNFGKRKKNICNVDFKSGSVLLNINQLTHRKQLGFEVTSVQGCVIFIGYDNVEIVVLTMCKLPVCKKTCLKSLKAFNV